MLLFSSESHQCSLRSATLLHAIRVTCKRLLCCRGCAGGCQERMPDLPCYADWMGLQWWIWPPTFALLICSGLLCCDLKPGVLVCATFLWERLIWHLWSRPIIRYASVKTFIIAQTRDHISSSDECYVRLQCRLCHVLSRTASRWCKARAVTMIYIGKFMCFEWFGLMSFVHLLVGTC